jgi:hypothetical protein
MTKDEALRLALEALRVTWYHVGTFAPTDEAIELYDEAITAIKAALEAKDEPWEKFCDSHCVWTDHHPDCKLAKYEPVIWGVDWGRAGDVPCVSIIKRLPDGKIEVVAVEYGPQRA